MPRDKQTSAAAMRDLLQCVSKIRWLCLESTTEAGESSAMTLSAVVRHFSFNSWVAETQESFTARAFSDSPVKTKCFGDCLEGMSTRTLGTITVLVDRAC